MKKSHHHFAHAFSPPDIIKDVPFFRAAGEGYGCVAHDGMNAKFDKLFAPLDMPPFLAFPKK